MNSPFANIFLGLQSRLQDQVPAIKYIDQDLGQLKSSTRPSVSWPCVLVDFEDFKFDNLSDNVQTARGTVVIRLGFPPFSNSSQTTPAPYLQQSIGYYDIEWALHKALQGWAPGDIFGSLCRVSSTTQVRSDSYRVREMRYSIAFDDYSTKRELTYVPAGVAVNVVVEGDLFPALSEGEGEVE